MSCCWPRKSESHPAVVDDCKHKDVSFGRRKLAEIDEPLVACGYTSTMKQFCSLELTTALYDWKSHFRKEHFLVQNARCNFTFQKYLVCFLKFTFPVPFWYDVYYDVYWITGNQYCQFFTWALKIINTWVATYENISIYYISPNIWDSFVQNLKCGMLIW